MSAGWAKLFGSIVTSSIWCEDDATVRAWIAMLATADRDGIVEGSVPGFANLARLSVSQMQTALEKLLGPDPHSRTPDHEGRRIEAVPGGWRILNYAKYREKPQAKDGSRAPYMRAYRSRKRGHGTDPERNSTPVTRNTEARGERREADTPTRTVADLRATGARLSREVAALSGESEAAVLDRCSRTSRGKTLSSFDRAPESWLVPTVEKLQTELDQLQGHKARPMGIDAILDAEDLAAAARR